MKLNFSRLPVMIVILSTLFIACNKNKRPEPDRKLHGQYTFKGTCRIQVDSTFMTDTVTGSTNRFIMDTTFDQIISVLADTENVSFRIQSALFYSQASFPVDGPYFYNSHYTLYYSYRFVRDSLYFTYNDHSLYGLYFTQKVEFAGKLL